MNAAVYRLEQMPELVGKSLGTSDWILIDQARIDAFAQATGDHQWIHVDPERAAAGPFGATVAHGFLTLSLLPMFFAQTFTIDGGRMSVNYGLNKVLEHNAWQFTMSVTIEREGSAKPVCVAEFLSRRYG
jgi:acyl dehydratase